LTSWPFGPLLPRSTVLQRSRSSFAPPPQWGDRSSFACAPRRHHGWQCPIRSFRSRPPWYPPPYAVTSFECAQTPARQNARRILTHLTQAFTPCPFLAPRHLGLACFSGKEGTFNYYLFSCCKIRRKMALSWGALGIFTKKMRKMVKFVTKISKNGEK